MKQAYTILLTAFALLFPVLLPAEGLKLREIQVIGSHNSYKSAMAQEILGYLAGINPPPTSLPAIASVSKGISSKGQTLFFSKTLKSVPN